MRRYIGYIPTGRAGSTSIRRALKRACIIDEDFIWDVPSPKGVFVTRVNRDEKDFFWRRWWETRDDVEMFTVVRNPYDRLVSGWLHTNKQKWLPRELTLEEYCYLLHCGYTHNEQPIQRPWEGADPEAFATAHNHGMNFETSIHTVIDVIAAQDTPHLVECWVEYALKKGPAFPPSEWPKFARRLTVIRFENLEEEFLNLCDKYGWEDVELKWENKTADRKSFESYHTPTSIDFVRSYYRYELEAFGYE